MSGTLGRKVSKNAIPNLKRLKRRDTDDSSLSEGDKFQLRANATLESMDTERPDWGVEYAHSERLKSMDEEDLRDHVNESAFGQAMDRNVPSKTYHDSRKLKEKKARQEAAKKDACCIIT